MRRRIAIWTASLLLLLLAAAGAGAGWVWWTIQHPFQGHVGEEKLIDIPSGQEVRTILQRLQQEGIVTDALLARGYLIWQLGDPPLKAGEYLFSGPMTIPEVLAKLTRGEVITHPIMLPEGLTLEETARHLAAFGFGDLSSLLQEMSRPDRISDLDPEADDLEGYLFPDTYAFARGAAESEIVDTLVGTFRRRFELSVAPLAPEPQTGDSIRGLVVLASIVEKEAQLDEERPIIAGVYANRLRRGIGLYADPTIIYALKQRGEWEGNLRRPHLDLDSPYNTYRYPGLPPGPIASPGLKSLQAAAAPADVPYLYFVSRNDGSHAFAATLAEHNRNVYRWQKLYWRERWAEEEARQKDSD